MARRDQPDDPKERVFGLAAARAVLAHRPEDVLSIAHARDARAQVAELLRSAARQRIAYRELSREDLDRLSGTVHHEGVCMLVRARAALRLEEVIADLRLGGFAVALDRVDNPHNIGAILRSAAFFGARSMLVTGRADQTLSPAAVRVAEGGAEHVPVVFVPELDEALSELSRGGVEVVGADAHPPDDARRPAFVDPCVIVLGSEHAGLSADVRRRCDRFVQISGSGLVESLNVSVAAGVVMATLRAQWEGAT